MTLGERGLGRDAGAGDGHLALRLDHLSYGSVAARGDVDGYAIALQPGRYWLFAGGTSWSGNVELLSGHVELTDSKGNAVTEFAFGSFGDS